MGNITGKNDGDEGGAGHDFPAGSHHPLGGGADHQNIHQQNSQVNISSNSGGISGANAATSSSHHITTSTSLVKKKNDTADQTNDDDPYAVLEKLFGDRGIPMVFRWELGGDEVFITGTFNNWSAKIPMARSGNDFVHIHELSRGKHAYKFIVDDEWRFTSDQHTMADKSGNINNFLDLTDFKPKFENLHDLSSTLANKYLDESLYGNRIPDINEYTKEPPPLPPHLRSIVLNYKSGVPQHVTLDHLYCTARKDGLMVLGMSQRYQQKYVTTIYYSPVNGGFPNLVPGSKRSSASASSATSVSTASLSSSVSTPVSSSKVVPTTSGQKRGFGQ
jgi:hypothetical protein